MGLKRDPLHTPCVLTCGDWALFQSPPVVVDPGDNVMSDKVSENQFGPSPDGSTPGEGDGGESSRPTRRTRATHDAVQEAADLDLMTRVASGSDRAVGELYDRFGSLVYRMAYQAMPTKAEAEDAVQEVFVRLWKTAGRYDPDRAALVTWVMLIARRHLVDKLRRSKARVKATSLDEGQPWKSGSAEPEASKTERDERFAALMKKIDALPELQKTVVTRAYLGGQTLRQIGEELNTPLGTIKSALSRALVRLRERTGEEVL
ncbi:MAG: sigma-70 family RNA polymerase sigma factor [Phycisphaeraceae bacterium]|nr:sigma-70 family RNA polymerase sigma factor [Phycisphaeraceae bacterium]MCW5763110.1 sigma-70 family RNA polymerase sigma factor [Phycisphaeraceae bacterium]